MFQSTRRQLLEALGLAAASGLFVGRVADCRRVIELPDNTDTVAHNPGSSGLILVTTRGQTIEVHPGCTARIRT